MMLAAYSSLQSLCDSLMLRKGGGSVLAYHHHDADHTQFSLEKLLNMGPASQTMILDASLSECSPTMRLHTH